MRDNQFPRIALEPDAGEVRLIAGDFNGAQGPTSTFTPINVWDVQLNAGSEADLPVPEGHTCVLVMQQGELKVDGVALKPVELVLFEREGASLTLQGDSASRVLILTGKPLNEPIAAQGPFVMNTREEILKAIQEYQAGELGVLD